MEIEKGREEKINFTWLNLFSSPFWEDPPQLRAFIVVVLIAIFLVGLVGNVVSCVVILSRRTISTTNTYLLSLAASDTAALAFVYLQIKVIWDPRHYPMGNIGCKVHWFVMSMLFTNSLITVTVLAVERYFALCQPTCKFFRGHSKKRIYAVVTSIWVISAIAAVLDTMDVSLKMRPDLIVCTYVPPPSMRVTNAVLIILIFPLPMLITFVMYSRIACRLNADQHDDDGKQVFNGRKRKKKALRMLVVLSVLMFLCWTPLFFARFLYFLTDDYDAEYGLVVKVLLYLCVVMGWLSIAVNPIVFSVMSSNFRQTFSTVLLKRRHQHHRPPCHRVDTFLDLRLAIPHGNS